MHLMRICSWPSLVLRRASQRSYVIARRCKPYSTAIKTDEYGIPLEPSWSVTKLLSSYPKPSISSQTLIRLHELSALTPPEKGTPEHAKLKEEIFELVRLVEAVKLVDTQSISVSTRYDRDDADRRNIGLSHDIPTGQVLLDHAARTQDGFYLVDTDRKRKY